MKVSVFIIFFIVLMSACGPKQRPLPVKKVQNQEKSLLEWNKAVMENEVKSIEHYLKTAGKEFVCTETGLYIFDEVSGLGEKVSTGDKVWISYSVELLDGTPCFQTDSLMPETFIMGRNRHPSGLNEGILRLCEGGSTNLVIPHYLLHGIAGDRKNIPPITPALFKVRLLKVEKR